MKVKVLLEKGLDGYIVATCPNLPGCVSQGKTIKETLKNIREAIGLYLEPDPHEFKPKKNRKIAVLNL